MSTYTEYSLLRCIRIPSYFRPRRHLAREHPSPNCPRRRDNLCWSRAPGAARLFFATSLRLTGPSHRAKNFCTEKLSRRIRDTASRRERDHAAYCHRDATLLIRGSPIVMHFRPMDGIPQRRQDSHQRVLYQIITSAWPRCIRLTGLGALLRCSRSVFIATLEKGRSPGALVDADRLLLAGSCKSKLREGIC